MTAAAMSTVMAIVYVVIITTGVSNLIFSNTFLVRGMIVNRLKMLCIDLVSADTALNDCNTIASISSILTAKFRFTIYIS